MTSKFDPALEMSRMYQYVMDRDDGLKGQIRAQHSRVNMREMIKIGEEAIEARSFSIEPPLAVYTMLYTSDRATDKVFSSLGGRSER